MKTLAEMENKTTTDKPERKKRLGFAKILLFTIGGLVALGLGGRLVYQLFWFESTDDAFLKAHIHTISSRVPGYVQQVLVDENQVIKKGQPILKLDASDYELQVREAQASFSHAHKDMGRFRPYMSEADAMDQKIYDEYQANALVSDARLNRARLQYQYTNLTAPEDGKIGRRNVETGDQIQAGQPLMALVEMRPWVEANFKEGQLSHLHLGQAAEIKIDALPHHTFHGTIESIAPGSGSTFSLLPPDNATGNFTKIVQRVPVKIVLDATSVVGFEDQLVPGMSSEVSVKIE